MTNTLTPMILPCTIPNLMAHCLHNPPTLVDSDISSITEPPGLDLGESAIPGVDKHQEGDDDEEDEITEADDNEEDENAGVHDTYQGKIEGVRDDEGFEEDNEEAEEDENSGVEDTEAKMDAQYGPGKHPAPTPRKLNRIQNTCTRDKRLSWHITQ
jgi:hypothetical protein